MRRDLTRVLQHPRLVFLVRNTSERWWTSVVGLKNVRLKRTGFSRGGLLVPPSATHRLGPDQRERHAAPPRLSRGRRAVSRPASALPQDGCEGPILFDRPGAVVTQHYLFFQSRGCLEWLSSFRDCIDMKLTFNRFLG